MWVPLAFTLGDQESSDDDCLDMDVPKETLESDEELRMHLLGMSSYFTEQGAKLSYSAMMLFVIIWSSKWHVGVLDDLFQVP